MVIIIPGFLRKKNFYSQLSNRLESEGFPTEIIDLEYNARGLEAGSKIAKEHLDRISEKSDIIAHSFGGIILKKIIHEDPEIRKKINSIIFVSVPHGGSWLALFLSMFPTARDMFPNSKIIKELVDVELPEETVNFLAESELKIWPKSGGLLKDHIDIVIPETDHDSIINSEDFISKTIVFIKSRYDRVFL